MTNKLFIIAPVLGAISLIFAFIKASGVAKKDAGSARMQEIAKAISDGAKAFLAAEYKILVVFIVALVLIIGFGLNSWLTAVAF